MSSKEDISKSTINVKTNELRAHMNYFRLKEPRGRRLVVLLDMREYKNRNR